MAITVSKARKLLGKTSINLSDNEVELIIDQFIGIAEIVAVEVGSKNLNMGIEVNPVRSNDERS